MNLPRYTFSKEVEPDLLHFLQISKQLNAENKNCDLRSHALWSKFLPVDENLLKKLDKESSQAETTPIIDLCSDDEVQVVQVPKTVEEHPNFKTITELSNTIIDDLETKNDLSQSTKRIILKCNNSDLEELFHSLENSLNQNQIYFLIVALQDLTDDLFVIFSEKILIPMLKKDFCDEKCIILFNQLYLKHSTIMENHCTLITEKLAEEDIKVFLDNLKRLSLQFQAHIVRNFVMKIEKLDDTSLKIIQTLLNHSVDYESLNKLVKMLSNVADKYSKDRSFGKLLMDLIQILGPNLAHVEQPLKHIVSGHQSGWKAKLQKVFETQYDDSMLFTQSFR